MSIAAAVGTGHVPVLTPAEAIEVARAFAVRLAPTAVSRASVPFGASPSEAAS